MELSRRNVLQVGALSALAIGGLTAPWTSTVVAKSASLLDEKLLPKPYRRAFELPAVLNPAQTGEDEYGRWASYVIRQAAATAKPSMSSATASG